MITQLQQLGLTQQEALVYLFLLENGQSTVKQLSKTLNISATNCYHLLDSLVAQKLITEVTGVKIKTYVARDPESLIQRTTDLQTIAQQLAPDLRALYTIQKNKPTVRFFDGQDGIQEIYLQTLHAQTKKIIAVGSTNQRNKSMQRFFDRYRKQVHDREIVVYDILTPNSAAVANATKQVMRGYYDAKLLPKNVADIPTDILIWDDSVALITLQEPYFGTIITQPLIAQTMSAVLETLWAKL